MMTPVAVRCSPPAASIARAIPKSATTAWPSSRRMFSGLMSRWTIPCRCAASRASATSRAIRTASPTGSWCSRVSRSRSDSPAT